MSKSTAPEMMAEIFEHRPQLGELFLSPDHLNAYSMEDNIQISDYLMRQISLLLSVNDVDFTLRHYPGKGWSAGAEIDSGIEGAKLEIELDEKHCCLHPGLAMLAMLWCMVVTCRWNPVVMSRRDFAARITEPSKVQPCPD